ncbi:MAG: malate synthase A, partial [Marmoricola sp.]
DVDVGAAELLDVAATPGAITERGVRKNVNVAIQYISSWLRGNGAAGIYGLMEDAATAEISRSQIWQWVHNEANLSDGTVVTDALVRQVLDEEVANIRAQGVSGRLDEARALFETVALSDDFADFLTLPAYESMVAAE